VKILLIRATLTHREKGGGVPRLFMQKKNGNFKRRVENKRNTQKQNSIKKGKRRGDEGGGRGGGGTFSPNHLHLGGGEEGVRKGRGGGVGGRFSISNRQRGEGRGLLKWVVIRPLWGKGENPSTGGGNEVVISSRNEKKKVFVSWIRKKGGKEWKGVMRNKKCRLFTLKGERGK